MNSMPPPAGPAPLAKQGLWLHAVRRSRHGNSLRADAVRDATGWFAPGRLHSILGQPGSGTTTLLAVIAGLERLDGGEVSVNGVAVSGLERTGMITRNLVGAVLPADTLLPHLSLAENVAMALEFAGGRLDVRMPAAAQQLLQRVGLPERSSGVRPGAVALLDARLACLARALAGDPPVLLIGAPEQGLSLDEACRLIGILRDLAYRDGKCVVLATQAPQVARLADEVWLMRDGRLLPATLAVRGPLMENPS